MAPCYYGDAVCQYIDEQGLYCMLEDKNIIIVATYTVTVIGTDIAFYHSGKI